MLMIRAGFGVKGAGARLVFVASTDNVTVALKAPATEETQARSDESGLGMHSGMQVLQPEREENLDIQAC